MNKQIISSRSFGKAVTSYGDMQEAIAHYIAVATNKLRAQHKVCQFVTVYIRMNRFKSNKSQHQNSETVTLIYPSDNRMLLVKLAKRALQQIWQEGVQYHKAGVVLSGVADKSAFQLDCFAPSPQYSGNEKSDKVMKVMDAVNQSLGQGTLHLAAEGVKQQSKSWRMKRENMSKCYTTRWDELLVVN